MPPFTSAPTYLRTELKELSQLVRQRHCSITNSCFLSYDTIVAKYHAGTWSIIGYVSKYKQNISNTTSNHILLFKRYLEQNNIPYRWVNHQGKDLTNAINSFYIFKHDEPLEDNCSICCSKGTKKAVITSCGHIFHRKCLMTWLKDHDDCPLCRTIFPKYAYIEPQEEEEEEEEDNVENELVLQHIQDENQLEAELDAMAEQDFIGNHPIIIPWDNDDINEWYSMNHCLRSGEFEYYYYELLTLINPSAYDPTVDLTRNEIEASLPFCRDDFKFQINHGALKMESKRMDKLVHQNKFKTILFNFKHKLIHYHYIKENKKYVRQHFKQSIKPYIDLFWIEKKEKYVKHIEKMISIPKKVKKLRPKLHQNFIEFMYQHQYNEKYHFPCIDKVGDEYHIN